MTQLTTRLMTKCQLENWALLRGCGTTRIATDEYSQNGSIRCKCASMMVCTTSQGIDCRVTLPRLTQMISSECKSHNHYEWPTKRIKMQPWALASCASISLLRCQSLCSSWWSSRQNRTLQSSKLSRSSWSTSASFWSWICSSSYSGLEGTASLTITMRRSLTGTTGCPSWNCLIL